jgi:hypothetical protein
VRITQFGEPTAERAIESTVNPGFQARCGEMAEILVPPDPGCPVWTAPGKTLAMLRTTTFTLSLAVSLASVAVAQTTTAGTLVNQQGLSCQGSSGVLTGGVAVNSFAQATYNRATGVLVLSIENQNPIVAGQANPVIRQIFLNFPAGTITGATLVSQTGTGGTAPNFTLGFDADLGTAPNPLAAGCFGSFNLRLETTSGGIANANAPLISVPNTTQGPVAFTLQLTGPGSAGITAESFMSPASRGGSLSTTVAMQFQGGGVGGQQSGFVGSCDLCRTSIFTIGNPAPGQTFQLGVTGGFACHACVWVSGTPGPVTVPGGIVIPIGAPLAASLDLGNFLLNGSGNAFTVPVVVPNNPLLSGFQFYVANITYYALNVQGFSFSLPYTVTIN